MGFYITFVILSYFLIGVGLKYIDQAYDTGIFSKNKANVVAVITALLMGYAAIESQYGCIIFLSIIASVAITKKIDNIAFLIGALTVIIFIISLGNIDLFMLEIVALLVFSGILDELGNDLADKNAFKNKYLLRFFRHRFMMKIFILALAIVEIFPILYLVAFLFFDMGYSLVDIYSLKRIDSSQREKQTPKSSV